VEIYRPRLSTLRMSRVLQVTPFGVAPVAQSAPGKSVPLMSTLSGAVGVVSSVSCTGRVGEADSVLRVSGGVVMDLQSGGLTRLGVSHPPKARRTVETRLGALSADLVVADIARTEMASGVD